MWCTLGTGAALYIPLFQYDIVDCKSGTHVAYPWVTTQKTQTKAIGKRFPISKKIEGGRHENRRRNQLVPSNGSRALLCSHALTGRAPETKMCAHNYDCGTCPFDQMLDDLIGLQPGRPDSRTRCVKAA